MLDIGHCPASIAPLEAVGDVTTVPPDADALKRLLPEFDAYLATLFVRVTRDLLDAAERLKAIGTPSTGTDHIDVDYARKRGVAVLSLKGETAFLEGVTSTAEMAWALLLAAVRKIPWSFEAAKHGDWARDRFRGHQLKGKTLGILGYGRLGKMVARYGVVFGMRVIACDILDIPPEEGVEPMDFDTLVRESDVLSIHVPLNDDTRGLIDGGVFSRMKKGACLVNTSRGAVIDEGAFLDVLESGRLGCAGIDVIHGEWSESIADHPLIRYSKSHDNLVISPHTGGVTFEAQAAAIEFTAGKLADYLKSVDRDR